MEDCAFKFSKSSYNPIVAISSSSDFETEVRPGFAHPLIFTAERRHCVQFACDANSFAGWVAFVGLNPQAQAWIRPRFNEKIIM